MKPTDERFDAKTTALIKNVRHHIKEEEDWFPKVRAGLSRTLGIGEEMLRARAGADPSVAAQRAEETVDAIIN